MKLIALVGSSGIGKGFLKQQICKKFSVHFSQPTILTTRASREDDLANFKISLSEETFNLGVEKGEIIYPHVLFDKPNYKYGFLYSDFKNNCNNFLLLELHPKIIKHFKQDYREDLLIIGLLSSELRLRKNLMKRETDKLDLINRLKYSDLERKEIIEAYKNGYINYLLDLEISNNFREVEYLVFSYIEKFINCG